MSETTTTDSATPAQFDDFDGSIQFGMPVDEDVMDNVAFLNATDADTLVEAARTHQGKHEDSPYFDSVANAEQKLDAAMTVISQSEAVLVKTQPWFVKDICGDEKYDRWEPFFVAFPETTSSGQMLFRNIAALSEVAYAMQQHDRYHEMAVNGEETDGQYSAIEQAQMAEQRAFTRYRLDSYVPKEWVDDSIVMAVIGDETPPTDAAVVSADNGVIEVERGTLDEGDIAFGLDRYINDHNEHKVRIHNDPAFREALKNVNHQGADGEERDEEMWETAHLKYKSTIKSWECDLSGLKAVMKRLLEHEDVDTLSVHRVTEKAYKTHFESDFLSPS